jgi:hypothetical protein
LFRVLTLAAVMPNGASAFGKNTDKKRQDSDEPTKNTGVNRPVRAIWKERQNREAQDEERERNPFPKVHESVPTFRQIRYV